MKIRIYYEDTDAGGIVYHTNYIKYCERARSEAFFEAGLNFTKEGGYFVEAFFEAGLNFTKEGGYFVVSALEAKFLASAVLGDEVFVRTKLIELKKASLVLEQEIYKFDEKDAEKVLFKATITLAFMKEGRLAKIDESMKTFINGVKF